jgi:hypothetical protein
MGVWPTGTRSSSQPPHVRWHQPQREALARREVPHGVVAPGVSMRGQGTQHGRITQERGSDARRLLSQGLPCSGDALPMADKPRHHVVSVRGESSRPCDASSPHRLAYG